jgi:uncharacterized C2H2 Zn-finger protein
VNEEFFMSDLVLVRIWNDNDFPYRETWKEKEIVIASRKCIEMELNEAVEFLGTFTPIIRDADGQPDPRFFKRLRMEKTSKALPTIAKPINLTCQACGIIAKNEKELSDHIDANHLDTMADKQELEKRQKNAEKRVLT